MTCPWLPRGMVTSSGTLLVRYSCRGAGLDLYDSGDVDDNGVLDGDNMLCCGDMLCWGDSMLCCGDTRQKRDCWLLLLGNRRLF